MKQTDLGKSLFLPVGMALAMALGWIWPEPGRILAATPARHFFIILVFFLSGWQFKLEEIKGPGKFKRSLAAGLVLNLLLPPLFFFLLPSSLDSGLSLGLAIMLCMPTTLISGVVIATQAGGNQSLGVAMTLILSVAGVFIFPYTLSFLLGSGPLGFSATKLLGETAVLTLVPLALGVAFKRQSGRVFPSALSPLSALCVIFSIWLAVSKSASQMQATPWMALGIALGLGAVVHALMLVLCWAAARMLKLKRPEALAFLFVGSQKTVVLASAILLLLPESLTLGRLAATTAACVAYHYAQIIMDSFLAAKLAK